MLYTGALNVRSSTPEDVIEGIILTVKAIREKQPNALILVQVIEVPTLGQFGGSCK